MKRITTLLASAAALALVPAGAQAQGENPQASDPTAKATFVGTIKKQKGGKATLRVRYTCAAGESQGLWVSAKQVKSRKRAKALTKEGSSKISAAWYQSHRNTFTCDGTTRTQTFTIDKVEPGSKGTLRKGKAYVQFCLTQGDNDLRLSKSGFVTVK